MCSLTFLLPLTPLVVQNWSANNPNPVKTSNWKENVNLTLGRKDKSWIIEVSMIHDDCVIHPIVVKIVQSGPNPGTNQPNDRLSLTEPHSYKNTHRHILIFTRRVDPEKCFTTLWPLRLSERRCSLILCISTLNHPIHWKKRLNYNQLHFSTLPREQRHPDLFKWEKRRK